MPRGQKSRIFQNFLEMVFFDIIEVLAKNRKHVLCILGGWPMDRDENASRATNLEFVGIFLKWPFRHNRGPGQKPKTRIMHFENSR